MSGSLLCLSDQLHVQQHLLGRTLCYLHAFMHASCKLIMTACGLDTNSIKHGCVGKCTYPHHYIDTVLCRKGNRGYSNWQSVMFEHIQELYMHLWCMFVYLYIYILTTRTLCFYRCRKGYEFGAMPFINSLIPNIFSFLMDIEHWRDLYNCELPCLPHAQMRWTRWSSKRCLIQSARSLCTTRRCWKPRIGLLSMSFGACAALPMERCPLDWPKAIWVSFVYTIWRFKDHDGSTLSSIGFVGQGGHSRWTSFVYIRMKYYI